MKEPLSLRLSETSDPERGAKFEAILKKRGANPSDVLRALTDAYNATCGNIDFPVYLVEVETINEVAERTGLHPRDIISAMCDAIRDHLKEYGGMVLPVELMPKGSPTSQGKCKARAIIADAMKRKKTRRR